MARAKVRVKGSTSARKQASADIARKKAKQKRVSQLRKRAVIIGAVLAVSYAGFGGWWLYSSGKVDEAMHVTHDAFWGATARSGFALKQVTLIGREHLPLADLKSALAITQGDPILAIDMEGLQKRLLQLPEVRAVTITRILPNELRVVMEERSPIAIWQREGKYAVIDRDGVVLSRKIEELPKSTLLVVGDDAPRHVPELMALLDKAPQMRSHVESAVRVGQRRWNVKLKEGVTILLPEENAQGAWQKFIALAEKNALLSKAILTVDLRLEDRVFITPLSDPNSPKILVSAKET